MSQIIKGVVQNRYDTSTNLTSNNPIMLAGELGIESDTAKFKYGDGVTSWNDLPYSGGGDAYWKDDEDYIEGDVVTYTKEQWKAINDNTNSEPGVGSDWRKTGRLYWFDYKDYIIGDLVVYGATLYIAIADNTNITPGTDSNTWVVFEAGSGDKVIGELFYSAVPALEPGCKWADYSLLSQSVYADLFSKIGHLYAKNSTDAASAEGSGLFYIPDAKYLFARSGKAYEITDAAINTSTDQITVSNHEFETGRAIKLQRKPGETPTLPTGPVEYDQYYTRVVDANTIEIYDTEAHAIDTSSTTGRVDFTAAGSGTFLLTTMGCYQSDAIISHTHYTPINSGTASRYGDITTEPSGGTHTPASDNTTTNAKLVSDVKTISAAVNVSNETRPSYVSLGMQIKCIGTSVSTGEPYDLLAFDTGWFTPADWTNAVQTITHNLGLDAKDLLFEGWAKSNQTGEQRISMDMFYAAGMYGVEVQPNDLNSINLRFSEGGVGVLNTSTGGLVVLEAQTSPQIRVKIYAPNFLSATVPIGNVTYKYDTGWFAPASWTVNDITITHNLGSDLEGLFLVGYTKTDNYGVQETLFDVSIPGTRYGAVPLSNDSLNDFLLRFTTSGPMQVTPSGTDIAISGLTNPQIRIVAYRPELVTENVVSPQGDTMSSSMSYTITSDTTDYLIDSSSVAAGQTLTLTRGTGVNVKNKVTLNNESSNLVIVTDGTTEYWVDGGETVTFWFNNTMLKRSPGMGIIYDNYSNTGTLTATSIPGWQDGEYYEFYIDNSTTPYANMHQSAGWFPAPSGGASVNGLASSSVTNVRVQYLGGILSVTDVGFKIKKILRRYR